MAEGIKPGAVKRINRAAEGIKPFKERENITFFTDFAREVGVPDSSMFGTPDLYEAKDMHTVILCIYSLGGVVQVRCPEFKGPKLGNAIHADVKDSKKPSVKATQMGGYLTEHMPSVHTHARQLGVDMGADKPADVQGLDADLKAKQAAKFDVGLEAEVCRWIEAVTGESKGSQTTHEWLKGGLVLCALANNVKPGVIKKPHVKPGASFQMENILFFQNAARALGVAESSMFGTPDLFEEKNMKSVIDAIYAFGGAIQKSCPEYNGPKLGHAINVDAKTQRRPKMTATSQYEAMQGAMEVERPRDGAICRGGA